MKQLARSILPALLLAFQFAALITAHAQIQWISLDQKFTHYKDPQLEQIRSAIVNLDVTSVMAQNRQAGNSTAQMIQALNERANGYSSAMQTDKAGYVALHNSGPDVDAVFAAIDSDAPDQNPSLAADPWLKAYIKDRWFLLGTQALIRVVRGESQTLDGVSHTASVPSSAPPTANNPGIAVDGPQGGQTPTASSDPKAAYALGAYRVKSSDTLWYIAKSIYPTDTIQGINKIKLANKDTLGAGQPLKVGQILIIPK